MATKMQKRIAVPKALPIIANTGTSTIRSSIFDNPGGGDVEIGDGSGFIRVIGTATSTWLVMLKF